MLFLRSLHGLLFSGLLAAQLLPAQVLRLAELNTTQVAALDRAHTVVILTDGIMEEHGPYLPLFTDGYLDEALTQDLARAIVARPGWTVVLFPTLPLGSVTAEVIGHRWSFPGSFPVRESTVRDVFMDLADSFGDQGFRHVLIVDSHGGPGNSRALDQASDYFHGVYGGRMTHLLGLMPVVDSVKALEQTLTPAQLAENGIEVHAGALEQSTGLFLRPDLSPTSYRTARSLAGADFTGLTAQAAASAWPGYLGAPSLATPALGALAYQQTMDMLRKLTPEILDGKIDPSTLPRYGDVFTGLAADVEQPRLKHEAEIADKHNRWLASHPLVSTKSP